MVVKYSQESSLLTFSPSMHTLTVIKMSLSVASDILSMHDVIVALLVLVSLFCELTSRVLLVQRCGILCSSVTDRLECEGLDS